MKYCDNCNCSWTYHYLAQLKGENCAIGSCACIGWVERENTTPTKEGRPKWNT